MLNVTARQQSFLAPQKVVGIPLGATVSDIVAEAYRRAELQPRWHSGAMVQVDGQIIMPDAWDTTRPGLASSIVITTQVHGGGGGGGGSKNVIGTVLMLAVVIAAPYVGLAVSGLTAGLGFSASVVAGAIGAMAFTAASMALIGAVFPASTPSVATAGLSSQAASSPTYSISGARNVANKFGRVPVVLGKHKHTPPLGARNYTEVVGSDEYLRMLVVWGYGPLKIEDIKIGDTPISEYSDVEIETREGREDDEPVTLYPGVVIQTSPAAALTQAGGGVVRSTSENADEISVDIAFPRGLTQFADNGNRTDYTVAVTVEYRLVGAVDWTLEHTFTKTAATTSAIRFGHRWTVTRGQYQIRMTRTTADTDSTRIIDDVTWSALRTIRNEYPIHFRKPVAVTALRIRATDQLSGAIDDLGATVTSYAPCWDGAAWTEAATQNPAALARLAITGPANDRAKDTSKIDASFEEFYTFCVTNGYKYNRIHDYSTSVWEVVSGIMTAGRAAPSIIDGKWGVIMDYTDKPIVQHFTPRNSWGFESTRSPVIMPHAWRAQFVNEDADYQTDERIIYDDGYTAANATKFESIEFSGITDPDLVWKFGRYHIAQARLRPEKYSFYADFEHLACSRGDIIAVSHDVTLWGSSWGRVKSLTIDGDDTTGFTLDDEMIFEDGKSYNVRFRLADGTSLPLAVDNPGAGVYTSATFTTPVATDEGPEVGDLCSYGEVGQETARLIVHSIERGDELSAKITCVDEAPAIYSADTGDIPAFDSNITQPVDVTRLKPSAPSILNVDSGTAALLEVGSNLISRIFVALTHQGGSLGIDTYRVRWRRVGAATWEQASASASGGTVILSPVTDGESYEFQAAAVSSYGIQSDWGVLTTETVVGQSEPPADVEDFAVNIVGTDAHLSWSPVPDRDLSYYKIRYSPLLSGATWANSVGIISRVGRPATSATAPAMAGTYLIKAFDKSEPIPNESINAGAAITNIAAVQGLNFVESITEEDPWGGVMDGTKYYDDLMGASGLGLFGAPETLLTRDGYSLLTRDGDTICGISESEYTGSGYYYFEDYIDLGDVFTVRATGSIESQGYDSTAIVTPLTAAGEYLLTRDGEILIGRDPLSAPEGSWTVDLHISLTDDDPSGTPTWGEWLPFLVGDYTCRAARFRMILAGATSTITPLVQESTVTLDMVDRVIGFSATVGVGGATVTFSPAFFVEPEIGIAVSDGQEGDGYTITGKSASGFSIAFTNSGSPVERNITGIAKAYGERA